MESAYDVLGVRRKERHRQMIGWIEESKILNKDFNLTRRNLTYG